MAVGTAIALASSLIPAIGKGITSSRQMKKADELHDVKRPTYRTPKSQEQSMNILRGLSTTGLPNKNILQEKAGESTSSAARKIQETATDPASALSAMTNVYGSEMETMQDIELQDAAQRLQNQQALLEGLRTQAGFEDRAFDINKFQPYMQSQFAASELTGASMQNRQGMLEDLSKVGGALGTMVGGGGTGGTGNAGAQEAARTAEATSALETGQIDPMALTKALPMTANDFIGGDEISDEEILSLINQDMSLEEISAQYGVPMDRLINFRKR